VSTTYLCGKVIVASLCAASARPTFSLGSWRVLPLAQLREPRRVESPLVVLCPLGRRYLQQGRWPQRPCCL
jgi:hypothetical protein